VANDAQRITPSSSQVTGLAAQEPAVAPPAFASEPPFPEAAPSCAPEAVDGEPEELLEHASDKAASDKSAAARRALEVFEGLVGDVTPRILA